MTWFFSSSVHNARLTIDFLWLNNVTLLDHPAWSRDLNPIENVWEMMAKEGHCGSQIQHCRCQINRARQRDPT